MTSGVAIIRRRWKVEVPDAEHLCRSVFAPAPSHIVSSWCLHDEYHVGDLLESLGFGKD